MADFKKTIATAKAKVAKAESEAFKARLEALDAILQDAAPHDVLTLCARALAEVARPAARRTRTNSRLSFCGC